MREKNPAVSVIIPTYNRHRLLSQAIESVLNQSHEDYELLVIDDASEKPPDSIIQSYSDSRIRYIKKDKNEGACKARNTGIRKSCGEFIAFLDSDDIWEPDKLTKQLEVFKNNPGVGVVYTGTKIVRQNREYIGHIPSERGNIFRKQLLRDQVAPTSAVMVRKSCFDRVGMFDPSLPARQDYDMWIRLSREFDFDFVKYPLTIIHRSHTGRISNNINSRIEAQLKLLKKLNKEFHIMSKPYRNKVIASQYTSIGRYTWFQKEYQVSRHFLFKSLVKYPFILETWMVLVFSVLQISSDNRYLNKINNIIKSRKT